MSVKVLQILEKQFKAYLNKYNRVNALVVQLIERLWLFNYGKEKSE